MKKLLNGKNILVTGSNRGMGRQMIETFAENGAVIFAHSRTFSEEHNLICTELSNKYSTKIIPIYFELTNVVEIKKGINEIRSLKIPLNGLVNNAGITHNALFQLTSIEEVRRQFEVNFFAPYILTQYIVKLMIRNGGGSIVNISSSAALDGNSGKSAYGSSKAALICMTRCISEELANSGIRANAICPGITETDMISTMPTYAIENQIESSSLHKISKPIDIANAVMFLLSDESSYITGQVIRVDGGVSEYTKRKN